MRKRFLFAAPYFVPAECHTTKAGKTGSACQIRRKEAAAMEDLIELRDVRKIYRAGGYEVRALDGVSLSIRQGEFLSIVGQSGSGKSTLMNILGCLDTPTSGSYRLEGEDVAGFSENRLSEVRNHTIGFVFQGFNLIPSLNALENVEMPLLYHGIRREERRCIAQEALTRVGLESRMTHRPCEMSGGQQQRVAIARAIAMRPPLILADEPTGNLDSRSGAEVIRLLFELHAEGRTIILITHDIKLAARARRSVCLCDGRVVEDTFCGPETEAQTS